MARDRTYKPVVNAKKHHASQEEIDNIRQDARHAKELLVNPFLKAYCENTKRSILELHARQLIGDVAETTEQNGVKRTITVPAKKEYTLLAGEYRFVERLLADLENNVLIAQELESKLKSEEIDVLPED